MNEAVRIVNNILFTPNNILKSINKSGTKVNIMGDTLEEYIKNVYANTFDDNNKLEIHEKEFSWFGNQNNPPDLIIRNGVAIEVKKIEGYGNIALNSSFPKVTIKSVSSMITQDCRNCENDGVWEKDLVYCIGTVKNNVISDLFIVYGQLYAAEENVYQKIKETVKSGIEEIRGVEFTETNELGKVKKVDPLGITDLRIRSMWSIYHPYKVYKYIRDIQSSKIIDSKYVIYALIPIEKLDENDRKVLVKLDKSYDNFEVLNVKIKNPNNPANLIESVLLRLVFRRE